MTDLKLDIKKCGAGNNRPSTDWCRSREKKREGKPFTLWNRSLSRRFMQLEEIMSQLTTDYTNCLKQNLQNFRMVRIGKHFKQNKPFKPLKPLLTTNYSNYTNLIPMNNKNTSQFQCCHVSPSTLRHVQGRTYHWSSTHPLFPSSCRPLLLSRFTASLFHVSSFHFLF